MADWQRIEEVFQAAADLPADERSSFISQACDGDDDLRREVESLLEHSAGSDDFIETRALDMVARGLADDARSIAPGTTVGPYKIVSHLGRGGMGEVYVAEDTRLERTVVLKFLPDSLRSDASSRQRFLREARLASSIDHANVCTIHEINQHDGADFIVMQHIEGRTLSELMSDGSLDTARVVSITEQIASGLAAAHERGIVHRDLKPANIILSDRGQVKILDFGLAKPIQPHERPADSTLTHKGWVLGTPAYMSPEQVRGIAVDHRSDIFSLGAIVYEMAAGRPAFNSPDRDSIQVMHAVVHEEPTPLTEVNPSAAGSIQDLVEKALAKSPDDRYQSAHEMLADLATISTAPETDKNRAVVSHKVTGTASTGKQVLPAMGSYRNWAIGTVLAGVVVLAGLLAFRGSLTSPLPPIRSLAVLPLKNLTGDAANDYLSDGISDRIIGSLAKAGKLKIISRNSVFQFKDKDVPANDIGQKLDADAVLDASVVQQGDMLHLVAKLIRTRDNATLWSGETKNRKLHEIVALQNELISSVAKQLQIVFDENSEQSTPDDEARRLYLTGRYFWNKRTPEALLKSVENLEQAAARDPNYAAAFSGLADSYVLLAEYRMMPENEAFAKARNNAARAIEIDERSADAHSSLGYVLAFYDWNFPGAEKEFKRAIEIDPNYATAHQWYGEYLEIVGRFDESFAELRQAEELDPLSLIIKTDLAGFYYLTRRYDQAIDECHRILDLEPAFFYAYNFLWLAEDRKGDNLQQAFDDLMRANTYLGENPIYLEKQRNAFAKGGWKGYWQERIADADKPDLKLTPPALERAAIYLRLGDRDKAFAMLDAAYSRRERWILNLKYAPEFDEIRTDPRYDALLKRLNLS